jgi:hypothetical protein
MFGRVYQDILPSPLLSAFFQGLLYEYYQQHTNYRGGKYRPAYWTMTNHAGQGKLSGALPNGRRAFNVFASGITPSLRPLIIWPPVCNPQADWIHFVFLVEKRSISNTRC